MNDGLPRGVLDQILKAFNFSKVIQQQSKPFIVTLLETLKINPLGIVTIDFSGMNDVPMDFLTILELFPNVKAVDLSEMDALKQLKFIPEEFINELQKYSLNDLYLRGMDINSMKLRDCPLFNTVKKIHTDDLTFDRSNAHVLDIMMIVEKNKQLQLENSIIMQEMVAHKVQFAKDRQDIISLHDKNDQQTTYSNELARKIEEMEKRLRHIEKEEMKFDVISLRNPFPKQPTHFIQTNNHFTAQRNQVDQGKWHGFKLTGVPKGVISKHSFIIDKLTLSGNAREFEIGLCSKSCNEELHQDHAFCITGEGIFSRSQKLTSHDIITQFAPNSEFQLICDLRKKDCYTVSFYYQGQLMGEVQIPTDEFIFNSHLQNLKIPRKETQKFSSPSYGCITESISKFDSDYFTYVSVLSEGTQISVP